MRRWTIGVRLSPLPPSLSPPWLSLSAGVLFLFSPSIDFHSPQNRVHVSQSPDLHSPADTTCMEQCSQELYIKVPWIAHSGGFCSKLK